MEEKVFYVIKDIHDENTPYVLEFGIMNHCRTNNREVATAYPTYKEALERADDFGYEEENILIEEIVKIIKGGVKC